MKSSISRSLLIINSETIEKFDERIRKYLTEQFSGRAPTKVLLSQMSRSWFSMSATPDAVDQPSRKVIAWRTNSPWY
jgi:hypothetical protein